MAKEKVYVMDGEMDNLIKAMKEIEKEVLGEDADIEPDDSYELDEDIESVLDELYGEALEVES